MTDAGPSRPDDFRRRATAIIAGPRSGLRVAIRALNPFDFIELGMLPGMLGGETAAEQEKKVQSAIAKDRALQIRMYERILIQGIRNPRVLPADAELRDPTKEIRVTEIGPDGPWYVEKILELSGLKEGSRVRRFCGLWPRSRNGRARQAVRYPTL